jgi:hypothetical protein
MYEHFDPEYINIILHRIISDYIIAVTTLHSRGFGSWTVSLPFQHVRVLSQDRVQIFYMGRFPVSFQQRTMDHCCNCDVRNVHLSHSNPYLLQSWRTQAEDWLLQKRSRCFFNTLPTRYDLTQTNVTINQLHKVSISYAMLLHITVLHSGHTQGLAI